MTFRFRIGRAIDKEVGRIALSQIDRAISQLDDNPDLNAAVHDCRKCLKRTRALLGLVRERLGRERHAAFDVGLRDAGRMLAGSRDAHVAAAMLKVLEVRAGTRPGTYTRAFRGVFTPVDAASTDEGASTRAASSSARAALLVLRADLDGIERQTIAREDVLAGVERGYLVARRHFRLAYETREEDPVHEWRKRVQRHWRHLQLIERIWPREIAARIEEAQRISELIGEHQDLSVLGKLVTNAKVSARTEGRVGEVLALCAARQDEIRLEARPHGERLFADRPRGLARRLEVYWAAAETERARRRAVGEAATS